MTPVHSEPFTRPPFSRFFSDWLSVNAERERPVQDKPGH